MLDFIILIATTVSFLLVAFVSAKMGYQKGYVKGSKDVLGQWRNFNERYGVDNDES